MIYRHVPVLLREVIDYLEPKPGENFIDCTLGGGGYTTEIAKRISSAGKVLAIDADEMAINNYKLQIINYKFKNVILAHDNFGNLSKIVKEYWQYKNTKFDGIVFDLGLSSAQLEDECRGFSFQLDAPLDMAFGETENSTKKIINSYRQEELEKIIKEYGEERFAKSIARAIVSKRKRKEISTTKDLVEVIEGAVPSSYKNNNHRQGRARKIHFATKTFQALRIATNNEIENLEKALEQSLNLLKSGGRLALISFHSLEDKIVKNFFKKETKECICPKGAPFCQCDHRPSLKILTKKIITAQESEKKENPRSRSAKLRVAIKI